MTSNNRARERVGIAGITGYTGQELVRLVANHPGLELVYGAAHSSAGTSLDDIWPGFKGLIDLDVESFDAEKVAERCDVIFTALPHGHAARYAGLWLEAGLTVVDLGADFRLKDPAVYERFYGLSHPAPQLLEQAVYGLVEFARPALAGAKLIANPGCYPTAVSLAAKPIVEAGLAQGPIFAHCLSGITGAGRAPNARNRYCEVSESALAYDVAGVHRHTPEIEQTLGIQVAFTPHLVPMNRGILATLSIPLGESAHASDVEAIYQDAYENEEMVVLVPEPPSTAHVRGSNRVFIHPCLDAERGILTVCAALDNLVKGAAGQAIQGLNVALGFDESLGLSPFPISI